MKLFLARYEGEEKSKLVEAYDIPGAWRLMEEFFPDGAIVGIREVTRCEVADVVRGRGLMFGSRIVVKITKEFPIFDTKKAKDEAEELIGREVLITVSDRDGFCHTIVPVEDVEEKVYSRERVLSNPYMTDGDIHDDEWSL